METYEKYCFLQNQTRRHCFKYNKEISRQIPTISKLKYFFFLKIIKNIFKNLF